MTDQLKNILIGLFVAIAITIGISLILFLEPNVGDGKEIVQVRFANIMGINVGTRVTYGGRVVGEVSAIKEVPDARSLTFDDTEKVFLYQLTLKLDSSVKIYSSDEIAIRTTGLMGERSIAILPRLAEKGTQPILITHEILYANSNEPMENTINQIGKVATKLEITVDQFNDWFAQNKDEITKTLTSIEGTFSHANSILASVEEEEIIPSIHTSIDLVNKCLTSIDRALDEEKLLDNAATLIAGLNQSVASFNTDGAETLRHLNQITGDIAEGKGTIGKLITSEDFYLRISSILGKADTLMNDINHYGILFQYDKSWQRQRTKRANEMEALNTPEQFRSYFEGEVSGIQTSLGRLTELLTRAEDTQERNKIIHSEAFKRDFGCLLRQVQALTESIKLYNEELMNTDPCAGN